MADYYDYLLKKKKLLQEHEETLSKEISVLTDKLHETSSELRALDKTIWHLDNDWEYK